MLKTKSYINPAACTLSTAVRSLVVLILILVLVAAAVAADARERPDGVHIDVALQHFDQACVVFLLVE